MTELIIDIVDISGGTHPNDKVRIWAPYHRADGDRVVSTTPVDVALVDGRATVNVLPGPARIRIMSRGLVDSVAKKVIIPDEPSVTLRAVIEDGFEWEPEVISRVATLASQAESAAKRAENVTDTVEWQGDQLSVMGKVSPPLTGDDGETPHIGSNGNWWVGGTDTGVRAQGEKGDPGDGSGGELWAELNPILDGKAPVSHDHTIAQVSGLQGELDGKASSDHSHNVASITGLQDELDGKAAVDHQHSWGDITDNPDTYPPESHSHSQSEVEGLEVALDAKAPVSHDHTIDQVIGLEDALAAAGTAEHTHSQSEVEGLESALDAKANVDHTHPEYATTAQVEARTPEIRVVSSREMATSPGVLYVVKEG